MLKRILILSALLTAPMAWAQNSSVCTTAKTITLQGQRFIPVFAITLTSNDTCNLTFQLPTDPNLAQTVVLKFIQSSISPYSGTISGGVWPSGNAVIPQSAGAVAFAKCEVDTSGAYCYPLGFSGGNLTAPQVTVLASGSGTYTTPTGTIFLVVDAVGGGGGGSGSGFTLTNPAPWSSSTAYLTGQQVTYGGAYYVALSTQSGHEPDTSPSYWSQFTPAGDGSSGGATAFGALTAQGGNAGTYFSNSAGAGGTAAGGDINIAGASGLPEVPVGVAFAPGSGGSGPFGGGANPAVSAAANSGSGGSGALATGAVVGGFQLWATQGGNGGGAGGYLRKFIGAPNSTYAYSVAAGGAGGSAGTNGSAGQAGASGILIVEAYQ